MMRCRNADPYITNQFEKMTERHSVVSGLFMIVALPAGVLLSVAAATAVVMFPFAFLLGWL